MVKNRYRNALFGRRKYQLNRIENEIGRHYFDDNPGEDFCARMFNSLTHRQGRASRIFNLFNWKTKTLVFQLNNTNTYKPNIEDINFSKVSG